jgi:hypothetical protein
MKVTARGWGRDMGETVIADVDLTEAAVRRDPDRTISFGQDPIVFRKPIGGVSVDWGSRVTMGGKYRWEIQLNTDEIIRLFKLKLGSELDVDLLDDHGFTVSDDLKKRMIGSIKLADLTIGDLAKLSSTPAEEEETPTPATVTPFRRRV